MTPIFLDTSGLIAVVNTDDQWHTAAETSWKNLVSSKRPLITTSQVLIEIGDGLSRVRYRQLAIDLYNRLTNSTRIEIVQATNADVAAA